MRSDIGHRDDEGSSLSSPYSGHSTTSGDLHSDLLAGAQAENYVHGMQHLVTVVQRLSQARTLEAIQSIVRRAARELTHADGATFVMRHVNLCYYADEDAISPLWKGQRFPMSACISGWAMLNRQAVIIEDIYADARIP